MLSSSSPSLRYSLFSHCSKKIAQGFVSSTCTRQFSSHFQAKNNSGINRRHLSQLAQSSNQLLVRQYSKLADELQKLPVKGIYFDSAATTPLDPRVLDAMMPLQTEAYGNPHSRTHEYGWDVAEQVEDAREKIANLIGARSKDIVFTSGATESNNMAIKGVAHFYGKKKKHIITTQIEHKCVLDSCRRLSEEGYEIDYLPVQKNGLVDLELLKSKIRADTALVSIMMVNNEIGVLQPIKEIGQICKERKVLFHTDAAQSVGKLPVNVDEMGIDLLSISGHKLYGPKGIGALYVRRTKPRVRLTPIINGGGQERGFRSGTLAGPLCVGLGAACEIAGEEMERDRVHVHALSKRLLEGLQNNLEEIYVNGDAEATYPGILNISFGFVEGESLLMRLNTVALSSGSACTSASLEPSYVLRSLGVNEELAHTSLRFGMTRFTTEEEVDYVVAKTTEAVIDLRNMSPLWEMHQEGVDISSIEWDSH